MRRLLLCCALVSCSSLEPNPTLSSVSVSELELPAELEATQVSQSLDPPLEVKSLFLSAPDQGDPSHLFYEDERKQVEQEWRGFLTDSNRPARVRSLTDRLIRLWPERETEWRLEAGWYYHRRGWFDEAFQVWSPLPPGSADSGWDGFMAEFWFFSANEAGRARDFWRQIRGRNPDSVRDRMIHSLLRQNLDFRRPKFRQNDSQGLGQISALAWDGRDLWIASFSGLVLRYVPDTEEETVILPAAVPPYSRYIKQIVVTPWSVFLAGSAGLQVWQKETQNLRSWPLPEGLGPEQVQTLAYRTHPEGRFSLFLGTLNGQLFTYQDQTWNAHSEGNSGPVQRLAPWLDGSLGVHSPGRPWRVWSAQGIGPSPYPGRGRPVSQWAFDTRGTWVYSPGAGLYSSSSIEPIGDYGQKTLLCLELLPDGVALGFIEDGLVFVNTQGLVRSLGPSEGGPRDVQALAFDGARTLAIGTLGEGLWLYDLE